MAYKILVISPLHNLGTSTVSSMMAQAMAMNNKSVMLTFMQPDATIPTYLGIDGFNDPTRSIMQVSKLIDTGALRNKDILDYAYQFHPNCHLLNVADPSLTTTDRLSLVSHVFEHTPTDVVIVDDSSDIDSRSITEMLDLTDLTFVVINMSTTSAYHLKVWLNETKLKDNPNIFIIVNYYNEVVADLRGFAKSIGIPANRVAKVHYNPCIQKCTRNGHLNDVLPLAFEYDPRVAELRSDFSDIDRCLNNFIKQKLMKGI